MVSYIWSVFNRTDSVTQFTPSICAINAQTKPEICIVNYAFLAEKYPFFNWTYMHIIAHKIYLFC